MIESIEIYLSEASQEVAIEIHKAIESNTWFGLHNVRRRLFFDVKHLKIYQITDMRKYDSAPELKVLEFSDREDFFLLIKFTLLTCKQLMTEMDQLRTLTQIKLMLNGQEARKQITCRTPPYGQNPEGNIPG